MNGSAMRSLAATMLTLQAVVLGLTTPVLISVESVSTATAVGIGLGLAVACLVTAGLLRRPWAYAVGWAIQAASLALGLLIPMMVILGVAFGSLWAGAYFVGRKIDRERAERAVLERDHAHSAADHHEPPTSA